MANLIRLLRHLDQQCTLVIVKVSVRGLSPPQLSSPMGQAHWCSPPTVRVKIKVYNSFLCMSLHTNIYIIFYQYAFHIFLYSFAVTCPFTTDEPGNIPFLK